MAPKRILQSSHAPHSYNHLVKRVKYFEEFYPEEEPEPDDEDPEEEEEEEISQPIKEHQQEKFQDEVEEFELLNEENLEEACYQDYFMTVHGYEEQEGDKLEHAGDGAAPSDSDMTDINPRSEHKISNSEAREKAEGEELWSKYPRLNESLKLEQFSEYTLPDSGVNIIKERLISIGNLKAKELEDKWKKLQVAETEVKLMRANLIQQQTQLILDLIS